MVVIPIIALQAAGDLEGSSLQIYRKARGFFTAGLSLPGLLRMFRRGWR
jgi:hypothetical protein